MKLKGKSCKPLKIHKECIFIKYYADAHYWYLDCLVFTLNKTNILLIFVTRVCLVCLLTHHY